jgi:hypothetical protein
MCGDEPPGALEAYVSHQMCENEQFDTALVPASRAIPRLLASTSHVAWDVDESRARGEGYAGLGRNPFAFSDVGKLVGVATHDNDR